MKVLIDIDEELYRKGVLDFTNDLYILNEKWRDGENFTIFRTEEEAKARFMEIAKDIGKAGEDPEILANDKDDMAELADGMTYSCGDNSVEIIKAPQEKSKNAILVLGTDKDMTLDTVFSKEDVRTLISDQEHSVYPLEVFSKERLSKIDKYGWDKYLESAIARLNKNFNAEDGLNWSNVLYAAEEAYREVSSALRKSQANGANVEAAVDCPAEEAPKSPEPSIDVPLDGLYQALSRYNACFDSNAIGVCGSWEVSHKGDGKDLDAFVASYDGKPMFYSKPSLELTPDSGHYDMELRRECNLSDNCFSQICDTVKSVYIFARMASDEQARILSNSHAR